MEGFKIIKEIIMNVELTEEQYEIAARKLCVRRGENPEQLDWTNASPLWVNAKQELKNLITMLDVLDEIFDETEDCTDVI